MVSKACSMMELVILKPRLGEDLQTVEAVSAERLGWTELILLLQSGIGAEALLAQMSMAEIAAEVNIGDRRGWAPLGYALDYSPSCVDVLLRAGANPRTGGLLWRAARDRAPHAIDPLIRAGVDVNARDTAGSTALHWAADHHSPIHLCSCSTALELVRHGQHLLNWSLRDKLGHTPLQSVSRFVSKNPHNEDLRLIHELYRDHTRTRPLGTKYTHYANWVPSLDTTPDTLAARNPPLSNDVSLIQAGLRGEIARIGELINAGAMIHERDEVGRTLLHLIAMGDVVPEAYKVATELVRHGGFGLDWDVVVGVMCRQVSDEDESDSESKEGTSEDERYEDADEKHCPEDTEDGTSPGRDEAGDVCGEDDEDDAECIEPAQSAREKSDEDKEFEDTVYEGWTALQLAEARLARDGLDDAARVEAENILWLIRNRRLPPGEAYIYPCMDPSYCDYCSSLMCVCVDDMWGAVPGGFTSGS